MAELTRRELGMEAELVRGWIGELTVWVEGRRVFRKGWFSSPPDAAFVNAIREALDAAAPRHSATGQDRGIPSRP